jgi:hypothetical protein
MNILNIQQKSDEYIRVANDKNVKAIIRYLRMKLMDYRMVER